MEERMMSLASEWRSEAEQFRIRGQKDGATLIDSMADDLEQAVEACWDEALTLREAAAESGYSEEHLGRLVRSGTIPNAGRKGAPRIRRRDVPRKASAKDVPNCQTSVSLREQIARSIADSGNGGNDG